MNLLNRLMGCVFVSAVSSCGSDPPRGTFSEMAGQEPIVGTNAATAYVPNVLFIGNSLIGTETAATHEDMPAVLSRLASARGETLNVQRALNSGYTLQQTWNAGTPQPFLSIPGQWDFVVLQEYSTLGASRSGGMTGAPSPSSVMYRAGSSSWGTGRRLRSAQPVQGRYS
jgi:hypothetical protein